MESIPENKVVFSSGSGTQLSWEDPDLKLSVFTNYLIHGLSGRAEEQRNSKFIDLGELATYVKNNVRRHTSNHPKMNTQSPRLWEAGGAVNEDFPVAIRNN